MAVALLREVKCRTQRFASKCQGGTSNLVSIESFPRAKFDWKGEASREVMTMEVQLPELARTNRNCTLFNGQGTHEMSRRQPKPIPRVTGRKSVTEKIAAAENAAFKELAAAKGNDECRAVIHVTQTGEKSANRNTDGDRESTENNFVTPCGTANSVPAQEDDTKATSAHLPFGNAEGDSPPATFGDTTFVDRLAERIAEAVFIRLMTRIDLFQRDSTYRVFEHRVSRTELERELKPFDELEEELTPFDEFEEGLTPFDELEEEPE